MKNIKDITIDDFVFKDEQKNHEKIFLAMDILGQSFNSELDYFLTQKDFLEDFDQVFKEYNANLLNKKSREKIQYVYETLCNPERGYILKTLIYKHAFKLLLKNLDEVVSKERADKLKPLLKNLD